MNSRCVESGKWFYLEILAGILIGAGISLYLMCTGFVPTGNDIFGHLYKAEVLYDSIREGNFYPLYTVEWYNGIQLFRYWPIFTYYVIAFVNFWTNDIFAAYYVYAGLTFFVSYLGFVLVGRRERRRIFVWMGILYWFLPDNLRVFFGEGNLARVMVYALLPLFFYFYTDLVEHGKHFIMTALMAALLVATHFMLAAMCAVIFVVYGFSAGLKRHTQFYGFYAFVTGIFLAGILLVPGLGGGLVSDSSSAAVDTIRDWSQSLYLSVSPFNRMDTNCSFGLGVLLMGIFGLWAAWGRREEKAGFLVGLFFFVLSDPVFTEVLKQFPLSQVFWMTRFVQMCYILVLYDFGRISWAVGRKYLLLGIVLVDILPSLPFFTLHTDLPYQEEAYLLKKGAALTDNRLGLVDESSFGSYPAYYVWKARKPYIQGWAIQGAAAGENLITMTESLQHGYYGYAFYQLLQLGADAVIIRKDFVQDRELLMETARDYGYGLVEEGSEAYLFDLDGVKGNFGVRSRYSGLAIGESSIYISYLYPGFRQGDSDCLTDYAMEELLRYGKIYLSDFTYDDLARAEEMIEELSEAGVRVYIDCTHMPANVLSIPRFLGVESRFISISSLDGLQYGDRKIEVSLPYEWHAVYLVPLEDGVTEYVYQYGSQELDYMVQRDNITFLGLDLAYLFFENPDAGLLWLMDDVFGITDRDRLVDMVIISAHLQYGRNRIIIEAAEKVNTTLAFQDNFRSGQPIAEENHMLVAGPGRTVIEIYYKHLVPGILCSLAGCVLMIGLEGRIRRERRRLRCGDTRD